MREEDLHFEPYLHLAGLTDRRALLSWGGFFFRRHGRDGWMVIDDEQLDGVHAGRRESIGERSRPYGPAQIDVFDERGNAVARAFVTDRNHVCSIRTLAIAISCTSTASHGWKASGTTGALPSTASTGCVAAGATTIAAFELIRHRTSVPI